MPRPRPIEAAVSDTKRAQRKRRLNPTQVLLGAADGLWLREPQHEALAGDID
jgi:hypothetical protein